ncbi:kinesin-like protein KIN-4C [Selaginella moellendorffii]|uniref:kinesin-like protein KIN-4C n=1 Tax=Selaginella moellendorffii TaxID=88036 RepID=UPI000D1CB863|nr:kinesin-like protein KIN-4C [Selaginella moellendorffii]|eukprot:XP_024543463.1 kinesin-like protein KIN-4C [Selaginella moellendorffii]
MQAVTVLVHIRPLIGEERSQGNDCVSVVPGEPQVKSSLGSFDRCLSLFDQVLAGEHRFTFDRVYGGGGTAPPFIFDQCVLPLVEGLFQGYNATVFAYGQTGSGKTYTMGTGYGSKEGVIPRVMDTLFQKIDALKHKADFQVRVSFIEVRCFSHWRHRSGREKLAGNDCLLGQRLAVSSDRQHNRSHAIFTLNVEQRPKLSGDASRATVDILRAKFHLVDLAGSERVKKTRADGDRFSEGVHINRGLLALGNVISALGADKKRGHVPYRDSKLTRLLQVNRVVAEIQKMRQEVELLKGANQALERKVDLQAKELDFQAMELDEAAKRENAGQEVVEVIVKWESNGELIAIISIGKRAKLSELRAQVTPRVPRVKRGFTFILCEGPVGQDLEDQIRVVSFKNDTGAFVVVVRPPATRGFASLKRTPLVEVTKNDEPVKLVKTSAPRREKISLAQRAKMSVVDDILAKLH